VTLTYQGMPASAVRAMGSAQERRRHLLAGYVERMLQRRARSRSPTPPAQTLRWLGWLARSMRDHDQTVFYLEQLQPDWLPSHRQQWLVTTGFAVIVGSLSPSFGRTSLILGTCHKTLVAERQPHSLRELRLLPGTIDR